MFASSPLVSAYPDQIQSFVMNALRWEGHTLIWEVFSLLCSCQLLVAAGSLAPMSFAIASSSIMGEQDSCK